MESRSRRNASLKEADVAPPEVHLDAPLVFEGYEVSNGAQREMLSVSCGGVRWTYASVPLRSAPPEMAALIDGEYGKMQFDTRVMNLRKAITFSSPIDTAAFVRRDGARVSAAAIVRDVDGDADGSLVVTSVAGDDVGALLAGAVGQARALDKGAVLLLNAEARGFARDAAAVRRFVSRYKAAASGTSAMRGLEASSRTPFAVPPRARAVDPWRAVLQLPNAEDDDDVEAALGAACAGEKLYGTSDDDDGDADDDDGDAEMADAAPRAPPSKRAAPRRKPAAPPKDAALKKRGGAAARPKRALPASSSEDEEDDFGSRASEPASRAGKRACPRPERYVAETAGKHAARMKRGAAAARPKRMLPASSSEDEEDEEDEAYEDATDEEDEDEDDEDDELECDHTKEGFVRCAMCKNRWPKKDQKEAMEAGDLVSAPASARVVAPRIETPPQVPCFCGERFKYRGYGASAGWTCDLLTCRLEAESRRATSAVQGTAYEDGRRAPAS